MAAASSVNNIAATFSACKMSAAAAAKPCIRPLASWNPQTQLPRALKSSFLGLYGGPGPKPLNPTSSANRSKKPTTSLNRPGFLACSSSSSRRYASASSIRAAAINVGDKLPEATLSYLDKDDNVQTVSVSDLTKGKKVVLVAVPGAFTPTCSQKHLPPFISKADDLRKKGIDTIACVSVNDAFVMKAWGQSLNVGDKVLLLADGNGEFTRALGVSLDLSDKPAGLGIRSRRYALVADDGVVKILKLEEGGAFVVSGADDILKEL